jgi:probable HAF family extracellular repeat protein
MNVHVRMVSRIGALAGAAALVGATGLPAHAATLTPTPLSSGGVAINARNEVLGSFTVPGGYTLAGVWSRSAQLSYLPYGADDEGDAAYAINAEGYVAGSLQDTDGGASPVLWSPKGTIIVLTDSGYGEAKGINDHRVAVGYEGDAPVRWSARGVLTDLPVPTGTISADAVAINDRGAILGDLNTKTGGVPLLWNPDGTTVDLATPTGDRSSEGFTLNLSGTSVGYTVGPDYQIYPVRWSSDGAVTVLGGDQGQANGINDRGVAVGEADGADGSLDAVRWSPSGVQTTLPNLPGALAAEADAINDAGYIVGFTETATGRDDAVEWTPRGRVIDLTALSGT